jgi:hypothetical protein
MPLVDVAGFIVNLIAMRPLMVGSRENHKVKGAYLELLRLDWVDRALERPLWVNVATGRSWPN